ncbi:hypothetical protein CEUSTIGMA_g725.t1 [Chlamydomonas eustigma]|uniref:Uncharacterized protein n=1 Tax=Chlamydomonas eustigma TaxID=1157962 RepID=A0A250WR50_9CHLO|nr:hypothetical protein CEUSTIGMA_g725.t1 [Chlamydomonas eustigma]|eukprot:GAX73271.1 hypothetical protein CEUSTIGMA_g725.t1 [Chlamydomonas eustigma]
MLESGWASTRRNPILKSKELWRTLAKYWDKRESFKKEADLSLLKIQNKSHNMIRGSTAGDIRDSTAADKNNSMIIGSIVGEKDNVHSFKSSDTHDGRTTFLFHEEARVIMDLFFKHLIVDTHGRPAQPAAPTHGRPAQPAAPTHGRPAQPAAPEEIISTMLPFELQLQESQRILAMLRVIWDAHNDIQFKGMPSPKHCSTAAGRQLLLDLVEASKNLSESACHQPLSIYLNSSPHLEPNTSAFPLAVPSETSNTSNISSSGRPDMDSEKITNVTQDPPPVPKPRPPVKVPYVMLRRLTLALLHVLYEEPHFGMGQGVHARCRLAVQEVSGSIVQAFASAINCSRPSRLAMELLHISKSGGTSMCQLAKDSGFLNPTEDIDGNCLLPFFYDEPKWSRLEAGLDAKKLWPAADCPAWVMSPDLTCDIRAAEVHRRGVNYYSNEGHLHEGTSMEGSAHACPQFETVIVLRHPVDRTRSHITEIDRVYNRFVRGRSEYKRPRDLENWTHWAPAAINNYVTRSLLGRHFMHCKDFGALGEKELLAAAVALSSLDHILVLEEGDLNDVAMRVGMGWIAGLASKRWRWSTIQDLQHDLGFPPGTMNKIQDWNLLDILLYVWGNALLRLDVSFHAATAALAHRVVSEPCPLRHRGTATSGSGTASTLAAPLDTSTSIVPVVKDMDEALKVAGLVKLSTPGMVQMSRGKLPFSTPGVRVIYRTGYINMDNKRKSESGMAYSMEHVLFGLVNTSLRSLFSNASLHSKCPQRILVSRRVAVDSNFTLQHGALLYQLPLYAHIPLPDLPLITLPPKRRVARTHTRRAAPTVIMKREQHLKVLEARKMARTDQHN